jgi:hypothetical protein
MASGKESNTPRSIGMSLETIIDRIQNIHNKQLERLVHEPSSHQSAFELMRNAVLARGKVVVAWAETEDIADDVAVNLVRNLTVEERVAILRVGHASEDKDTFPLALLASMMECPLASLWEGRLTDQDWDAMTTALGRLLDFPLHMFSGTIESLPDCISQWRKIIPGGLRQVVIFRGLHGQEVKSAKPSFPTTTPYGRIADLVAALSDVAVQKGLCVVLISENPFSDRMTAHQLANYTMTIPLGIEAFSLGPRLEESIHITWVSSQGTADSVYHYRSSCARIDWDGES